MLKSGKLKLVFRKNTAQIFRNVGRQHSVFGKAVSGFVCRKAVKVHSAHGRGGFYKSLGRKRGYHSRKQVAAASFCKTGISGGVKENVSVGRSGYGCTSTQL